jgi:tetratricopeptide (TPR) repeat protein
MKTTFLSRFTPSLMTPEALEAVFVQRENLAERIVEVTRESVLGTSKHHTLLIGPRGIGKTHLISIIYHRIRAMDDLRDRLLVAWLREEEWGVTSFLDLLLRIFRVIQELCDDSALAERVESLYELSAEDAERSAAEALKESAGNRTLFLVVENLGDLFEGLGDEGQKRLRAFIQENPFVTILATAQSLFNGVRLQTSPFYGFFRIHHLGELSFDDAKLLLARVAEFTGDSALAGCVATPMGRARVRAVHHLAGGNHRVYVIFSEFLTCESLDDLVEPLMRTLDELTPYYQARMAWLSPQQRKIVEFMCDRRGAVTVKEIAERCFMTHQTASSQLKTLREIGYARSTPVGRESYYELSEPLMRLCVEVKKHRGQPIRLLVDFLRLWYSREELKQRLAVLRPAAVVERQYIQDALRRSEDEAKDPREAAFFRDFYDYAERGEYGRALEVVEELGEICGEVPRVLSLRGDCLYCQGRHEEALACFEEVTKRDPSDAHGWCYRAVALGELGRHEEALTSLDRAIELEPDNTIALYNRAVALARLGRIEEALAFLDKVVDVQPDDGEAWLRRGVAQGYLGRRDEAVVSLQKAVDLDAKRPEAWEALGMALNDLGRYEEALTSFDRVAEPDASDGDCAWFWYNRGVVFYHLGRHEEALTCFEKAGELDPKSAQARANQGAALGSLRRWDEALVCCEKAIDLGDESAPVVFNRVEFLLALGRSEEGLGALDETLQRFARSDEPYAGDTTAILRNLLTDTSDTRAWETVAAKLTDLYEKHGVLGALGQGLVASIPALVSEMTSDAAAQTWLDVWQELAADRAELQLPLRLVAAAVRYRQKQDPRVLLELSVEERKLLEPLLGIEEPSET